MRSERGSRPGRLMRTATFAALLGLLVLYAGPVADATRGLIALPALVRRSAPVVRWHGTVPPGGSIEVTGINGAITATPAEGHVAEIVAERSARREDPAAVAIAVVPHAGGLAVCAIYEPQAGEPCRPGDDAERQVRREDVRVRFHVRVPTGVRFTGRTVDGDVTAEALDAPVTLASVNGALTFSTRSYGEARTVNGSIRAAMGSADWSRPLSLETVNGSIAVDLPASVDADLYAHTRSGETTVSPPLPVAPAAHRAIAARLGRGGRTLRLQTVNGSIRVRR